MIHDRIVDVRRVRLGDILPNEKNWRKHGDGQRKAFRQMVDAVGYVGASLVRELDDGRLQYIDGHMRSEEFPEHEGTVLVTDLTEQEADALLATFDSIAGMADPDAEMLESLLRDVSAAFDDLGAVVDSVASTFDIDMNAGTEPQEAPEAQMDRAEELLELWQVRRGDVWEIPSQHGGVHRLMCGDSTDGSNVDDLMQGCLAKLLVTDPPYGVSYADKNAYLNAISPGNRVQTPIVNDHSSVSEMADLWLAAFKEALRVCDDSASYYITSPQGGELMMMMMMIERAGWQLKHCLIWVKNNHVLGRADYNYKHEPILYGWKKNHVFYGSGEFKTSVWTVDKPQQSKEHPTMKPVPLFAECLKNSSAVGDLVFDPFGGSGTTLIACEQLGRVGHSMEYEPRYCAVILQRMADMGLEPMRVVEGTE